MDPTTVWATVAIIYAIVVAVVLHYALHERKLRKDQEERVKKLLSEMPQYKRKPIKRGNTNG